MNNLIASDMRRMLKSKFFYIFAVAIPIVMILVDLFGTLVVRLLDIESPVYADALFATFEGRYSFLLPAVFIALFAGHELVTGCIRNKIISGNSRYSCFLSSSVCMIPVVVVVQLVAFVTSQILGLALGEGFTDIVYMLKFMAVCTCANIVLAIFMVALTYLFSNSNGAYIAGGLVSVMMIFLGSDVMSKLYPEDGIIRISGTKLAIYQFIDRYVPFSYPMNAVLKEPRFYIIGIAATLVIALLIGGVFTRKDMK